MDRFVFGKSAEQAREDAEQGVARVGGLWRQPIHRGAFLHAARALLDHAVANGLLDEMAVVCLHLQRHALELTVKSLAGWSWSNQERRRLLNGARESGEPKLGGHDLLVLKDKLIELLSAAGHEAPKVLTDLCDDFARLEDGFETRWRYDVAEFKEGRRKRVPGGAYRDSYDETSFPRREVFPVRELQERLERMEREVMDTPANGNPTSSPTTLADALYTETWELNEEEGHSFGPFERRAVRCADCGSEGVREVEVGYEDAGRKLRCRECDSPRVSWTTQS